MDELTEYQHRRLELADMLRAALYVARGRRDEEAEEQARRLLVRLAEDRFQLAVVGQFSRGKSTLMNAVLGQAYLPTGALPMTSVVTTVRYGCRPQATARRRRSAAAVEVPIAELARYVAQASAERTHLQVAAVDVEVPAEVLRLGFTFVDTPGVGSAYEANTATTRRFLPEADAVIFVTGFDSALTGVEVEFLAEAARHAGKLFLVVNKRDRVSDAEAADVLRFVGRRLGEDLHLHGSRVYALSALQALRARLDGDAERLADSGLPALQDALVEFLTTQKAGVFLANVAGRAARLVARQRRDLLLGRLRGSGGPDPDTVASAFETRLGDLYTQQQVVAGKMAAKVAADLPGLLAERAPTWRADLRQMLEPQIDDALSEAGAAGTGRAALQAAAHRLEHAGRATVADWLARRATEVHELVVDLVADEIGTLLALARSPGIVGAEIAGLALADDAVDVDGWSVEELPTGGAPGVNWSVPLTAPRWPARRQARDGELRRLLGEAVNAAVAAVEQRTREAFVEVAGGWVGRLREQAEQATDRAAERFRANLGTKPREEDLTTLDDLGYRLAAFHARLRTWQPNTAGTDHASGPPPATVTSARRTCVVCHRLEATLQEYLGHDQLRLATRESDQTRHAQLGGYCPLHTWQYQAMAAPVGIAAGYAKLAESTAAALDTALQRWDTPGQLAHAVTTLTVRTEQCPVCAALAGSERRAVADVAARAPVDGPTTALCLRHLGLVLAARPTPTRARALLRAAATALRRHAEDMRSYALKREALRAGLVSEEESRAYLATLHLLAGAPALVRPWFPQE